MSRTKEIETRLNTALAKLGFRKRGAVLVRPLTKGNVDQFNY